MSFWSIGSKIYHAIGGPALGAAGKTVVPPMGQGGGASAVGSPVQSWMAGRPQPASPIQTIANQLGNKPSGGNPVQSFVNRAGPVLQPSAGTLGPGTLADLGRQAPQTRPMLVKMRAPDGEIDDVDPMHVGYYEQKGAVRL